jgi:hypothetical protein
MLHTLMGIVEQRLTLYPCQIAFPLFKGHRPADLVEMLQHGGLALGTELSALGERLLNLRSHSVRSGEQLRQLLVSQINPVASLGASRQVLFVQLGDPCELGIAQMEFLLQPG